MWKRSKDINSRSIGIEIVYPGEILGEKIQKRTNRITNKLSLFLKKNIRFLTKIFLDTVILLQTEKLTQEFIFPWEALSKNSIGLWAKNRPDNSELDKEKS